MTGLKMHIHSQYCLILKNYRSATVTSNSSNQMKIPVPDKLTFHRKSIKFHWFTILIISPDLSVMFVVLDSKCSGHRGNVDSTLKLRSWL